MYNDLVKQLRYCSKEQNGCGMCALSSDCVLRVGLLTQAADAIDKLAAYEDAEEQGRMVILPCKVGDAAYVIWDSSIYPENPPAVREDHITQVKFTTKGYAFKTWRGWYHKSDIGKTIFLTREEAEAALKGGRGDANN